MQALEVFGCNLGLFTRTDVKVLIVPYDNDMIYGKLAKHLLFIYFEKYLLS